MTRTTAAPASAAVVLGCDQLAIPSQQPAPAKAQKALRRWTNAFASSFDEQDRSLWDRAAISQGVALVSEHLPKAQGAYLLQAAIAAVHDQAASPEQTDWEDILGLYSVLMRLGDNPMVALNHAIALAMVHGPRAGLARLEELARDPRLTEHYRLQAVKGHLLERAGDSAAAMLCYRRAAAATLSTAERDYLVSRVARIESGSA